MFKVKQLLQQVMRPTTKHIAVGGVFVLALAGAIGLGLHNRAQGSALTTIRECEPNSIDYKDHNGGCGAYSPSEYIKDLRQNDPSDLQAIAKNFGTDFNLSPSQYDDFATNAKDGIAYKNGDVKLMDGTLVATNAWSIGRDSKSYASKYVIAGTTYYKSYSKDVFRNNEIPVMVYFDKTGTVQYIAMKPCGNLMAGTKVVSSATCKALNAAQDQTNPNLYNFTTNAVFAGNAKLQKVVYHFSDTNTDVTETSLTKAVPHTFAKAATVTVTVYATVPGGNVITVTCQKQIAYTPPMAVCTALVATALDDKKQQFRFTIKTATDKNTTVKNADFTVDGTNTTSGVTTKDNNGNLYKEYTFTDDKEHTVTVVVRFNTLEGEKTDTNCKAKVTSKKTPMCTVPGHENLPPNDERCGYCKPGIPIGDSKCNDTPTPPQVLTASTSMPVTGPGNVIGLFAGVSIAGAVGHRLYLKRRAARG